MGIVIASEGRKRNLELLGRRAFATLRTRRAAAAAGRGAFRALEIHNLDFLPVNWHIWHPITLNKI